MRGYFATDVCKIGNNQVVLPDLEFGLFNQSSVCFKHFDAIVGLAYPTMAYKEYTPLFDRLIK